MPLVDVLIPMKPLPAAKTRLAAALEDNRRRALVLLMLSKVLGAATAAAGEGLRVTVLGGDGLVRLLAVTREAAWVEDSESDVNAALWALMQQRYAEGADATLYLPADLLLVADEDLPALLVASRGLRDPVAVRAQRDGGTNALLLPKSAAFKPALGEDSFRRHCALAQERGISLAAPELPRLAFDLDTVDDLRWAEQRLPSLAQELDLWEDWIAHAAPCLEELCAGSCSNG